MTDRRERVILELADHFSAEMGKAAAATALLNRELNSLSGSAVRSDRSIAAHEKHVTSLGNSSEKSGKQIDKLSGRLALLAQAAAVLGPALVPVGAAAIPAISGMTAELGFTVAAAGTALLAFHGLGDGLKALNKAQLDPTAENLEKMRIEMDKLGPTASEFVRYLDSLGPQLQSLQFAARDGLFPGLEDGIKSLMTMLPQVSRIIATVATTMGDLSREAGEALSGEKFRGFFDYIEHDAQPTLIQMGRTLGNLFDGFGAMVVAFSPLSRDFSAGFESMSASFADWAHSLDSSDSFSAFVVYVQKSGPQVLDLLGSLADAFVGIAEAAAPVGAVVVPVLTAMADAIAAISKSDIGTPIFAALAVMSLLSRATASYGKIAQTSFGTKTVGSLKGMGAALVTVTSAQERATLSASALARAEEKKSAALRGGLSTIGKSALAVGGLALATSGAAESMGLSNTASLALMGTMAGPWGAAIGGGIGLAMDMAHANDDLQTSFNNLKVAMDSATPDPESLAGFNAQIDETTKKLAELKAKMADGDSGGDSWNPFGKEVQGDLLRFKNTVEGWFGSSDVEEYQHKLDAAREKSGELAAATEGLGAVSRFTAGLIKQENHALREARVEAGKTAGEFITLGKGLDDAKVSLSQWIRQMASQADALRNFRVNAEKAADKGLRKGLIAALQEAGPAGALRMKQLANATDEEIGRANRAWRRGQDEIKKYTNAIGGVPTNVNTKVTANTRAALSALAQARRELAAMDGRTATMYLRTVRSGAGGTNDNFRYDSGGFTGAGGKYEPAGIVHRGEVVLPQEVVRRDKGFLSSRYGFLPGMNELPGFAVGGFAGAGSTYARTNPASRAASELARGLDKASTSLKKELEQRDKLLKKELERDQAAMEREKERLQMLKDERKALVDAVKSNFQTDIFGGGQDLEQAAKDGLLGPDFMNNLSEWMRANKVEMDPSKTKLSDYAGQYLATLSPAQTAALQTQAGLGTLDQDARNAGAFEKDLRKARRRGLNGGLFAELAQSGNLDAADRFAHMTRAQIRQYERAYSERNQAARSVGRYAGDAQFSKAIQAQTKVYGEAVVEMRETKRALHRVEQQMHHLTKAAAETGPDRTAQGVGKAINGAVANAQRKS